MIARLTPSTYGVSNSSYVTITDVGNMYNNIDNETYTTIQHTRATTTVVSVYLRGFNISSIPDNATINSFTIKIKARESQLSTSTSYRPALISGTSMYSSMTSSNVINTSVRTITFSGSLTWQQILSAGTNFGIRVRLRRSSTDTAGYVYLYGAEIEVDYDLPQNGGLYLKQNNEYIPVSKVYKKVDGSWIEQENIENLFNSEIIYIMSD